MARRAINMFDIQNLLHWWQQGHPLEFIHRSLGIDPKTARKYIKLAQEAGIEKETPLTPETLQPLLEKIVAIRLANAPAPHSQKEWEPYRHVIGEALGFNKQDTDESQYAKPETLTVKTLWRRLVRQTGIKSSYSTFRRYVCATFGEPSVPTMIRHLTPTNLL